MRIYFTGETSKAEALLKKIFILFEPISSKTVAPTDKSAHGLFLRNL